MLKQVGGIALRLLRIGSRSTFATGKFLLEHRQEIASGIVMTGSAAAGAVKGGSQLIYDLASLKLYSKEKLENLRKTIEKQSWRYQSALEANPCNIDSLAIGGELLIDMLRSGKIPADVQAAYEAAYPRLAQQMKFCEAVQNYSDQHLIGFLNPVKGKLFELKYAEWLNDGHLPDGYHAHLAQWTNQPGWDLAVTGPDGHVAELLQLKATDSVSYVQHAIDRYPDIQVVTTDEVYSKLAMHGAAHSAIHNSGLTDHVASVADTAHVHMDFTPPVIALALIAFTSYRTPDLSAYMKARQFGERGVKSYLTYLLGGSVAVVTQTWWLGILTGMGSRWMAGRGRQQREMYRHLECLVQRLLQGTNSSYGECIELTQHGITALIGSSGKSTFQELKKRITKNTLFDIEEPNIKKSSLHLPPSVMEAIHAIIFSESRKGKQIRKSWHASLPAAWGSPTGTTILLYGPPGTGKTLTAQHLAGELKLPLLKTDSSKILSCWVGESEQNVRRIFDDYASLQKDIGTSPILLFNEADQLLGNRDGGANSADRMNSNMQNLFLEGLEKFSGILVATTNRRDLLDEAFSRRFTYKLELPPPDKTVRISLWKSHLPMKRLADDVDINNLSDLVLSGGEIRLVIERAVRLSAYRGISTINHQTLVTIAQEELSSRMKRNGSTGKIGFGAGIISEAFTIHWLSI